ncbi:MAG: SDR family oxidoreductase [Candidatus Methanospirareceae archaeon]
MKTVVTGGAGFIGANLAAALLLDGHEVHIIDNLSTGKRGNIIELVSQTDCTFIKGSVTDLDLLRTVFSDIDCVFHQAAIPSVQRSVEDPRATNEANVSGTLAVLIAARECGVKKVVYASSSSVYGDTPTLPKTEEMIPNPKSPYAVSKLTGEYYCRVFSEVYGLKTICLRYFNVYGPKQDPSSDYAAVIPRFITRALEQKSPIIYGDGTQTRDFTYVEDVAHANIQSMKQEVEGIFNIACGEQISINELARIVMDLVGVNLPVIYDEPRSGDIKDSLADISRARKELVYNPGYSLTAGLEETIRWFQTAQR